MNKIIPISKKARKKLRLARYPALLTTNQPTLFFSRLISTAERGQCRRLPREWGLGKGKTEANLPPAKSAERLLQTHNLATQ
jgi:hypothetical protein